MSKGGFSTLNRWLGKKNKDKGAPNGKLSKSSQNLSTYASAADVNETSQLEYNRITPLPAATSNAPFEQTFRITVLLPKDQLYVTRLGARVPLSKLLELVCENKLLDKSKYEFRNPVDASQVYNCDLTIGAVGLSEIRLCHTSESYDNFNVDEVIKLQRTSQIRDSLSSSEFSIRNSKHTTKTASPYSSSNSLNSMDSTGMNYTPPPALPTTNPPKLTAPPRKKRAAPRPPSQMVIPEKEALVMTHDEMEQSMETLKNNNNIERKDYYVSTPNLPSAALHSDCNGNTEIKQNGEENGVEKMEKVISNGYATERTEEEEVYAQIEAKNKRNLYSGSVQNLSTGDTKLPEPSPRKRLIQIKKKSAPAPPPRGSMYSDDCISVNSATLSIPGTPTTPNSPTTPVVPTILNMSTTPTTPTTLTPNTPPKQLLNTETQEVTAAKVPTPVKRENLPASTPVKNNIASTTLPKPVPRSTTTTLLNAEIPTIDTNTGTTSHTQSNVSKVMLNRTPTPEPRSLSTEPPEMDNILSSRDDDDNVSKQADSGIGEPVPSPIPDSLPSESSTHECKSTFESSSDDDDLVKVYNFKLGKTITKPLEEHKTLEDLTLLTAGDHTDDCSTPSGTVTAITPSISEDTTSWNFTIPLSPPPNFADTKQSSENQTEPVPDAPITPKIKQRPVLDFELFNMENNKKINQREEVVTQKNKLNKMQSDSSAASTPMDDIVDELATIINEQRMNTLIRRPDEQHEIESAKPNTLKNFSITTISQQNNHAQTTRAAESDQPKTPEDEKLYRKRGSITSLKQSRGLINRADSFHATNQALVDGPYSEQNGLNSRSASYLSLTKLDQNGLNLNRRRSSSELSIGETPSLQSVEIIKTILNSRKNSLANSSDGENKQVGSTEFLRMKSAESTDGGKRPSSGVDEKVEVVARPIDDSARLETVVGSIDSSRKLEVRARVNGDNRKFETAAPITDNHRRIETIDTNLSYTRKVESVATTNSESRKTEVVKAEAPSALYLHKSETSSIAPTPAAVESAQVTATPPDSHKNDESAKPKEHPKVYRYSGPPSINFSTWNERPKSVHVSIKNEGDYIFGGKNSNQPNQAATTAEINVHSLPRTYKKQQQSSVQQQIEKNNSYNGGTPHTLPKPTSLTRMGIPEQTFKVPITVKPLKDVTVEEVQPIVKSKKEVEPAKQLVNPPPETVKQHPSAAPEVTIRTHNFNLRPVSMSTNTATLPRSGPNRFSTAATNNSLPAAKPPASQVLLRSTSITKLDASKESKETTISAPFGQNTLRKTGFKEKILAKEEAALTQPLTNGVHHTSEVCTTKVPPQPPAKPVQSAKVEMKQQKTSSVYVELSRQPAGGKAGTLKSSPVATSAPKSAPAAPKSAPVYTATPPPPAPPMAQLIFRKPTRSANSSNATTPTTPSDPRDQLLAAIRSFKREELNRT